MRGICAALKIRDLGATLSRVIVAQFEVKPKRYDHLQFEMDIDELLARSFLKVVDGGLISVLPRNHKQPHPVVPSNRCLSLNFLSVFMNSLMPTGISPKMSPLPPLNSMPCCQLVSLPPPSSSILVAT